MSEGSDSLLASDLQENESGIISNIPISLPTSPAYVQLYLGGSWGAEFEAHSVQMPVGNESYHSRRSPKEKETKRDVPRKHGGVCTGLLLLLVPWKAEDCMAFRWEHWCSGKHCRTNLCWDCQTYDRFSESSKETGSVPDGGGGNWERENEGNSRSLGASCVRSRGEGLGLGAVQREPQPAPMEQGGQGTVKEPHYPNDAFPSSLREESETRTRLRNCQSGTEQWCLQSSTQLPEEANLDALEENLR